MRESEALEYRKLINELKRENEALKSKLNDVKQYCTKQIKCNSDEVLLWSQCKDKAFYSSIK